MVVNDLGEWGRVHRRTCRPLHVKRSECLVSGVLVMRTFTLNLFIGFALLGNAHALSTSPEPASEEPAVTESDENGFDGTTVPPSLTNAADSWRENANAKYYDTHIHLAWRREMGDYFATPMAQTRVRDTDSVKKVHLNVIGNDFVIRSSNGNAHFRSREASSMSDRPLLSVRSGLDTKVYQATRDTWLSGWSRSLGKSTVLQSAETMLVAFDDYVPRVGDQATLTLTTFKQYGDFTLSVHKPDIRPISPEIPTTYDPTIVRNIDGSTFKPLSNRSFSGKVVTGWWEGKSLTAFAPIFPLPPADEYYLTVVIKLHDDFVNQGGKLPGLANTGNRRGEPDFVRGINCTASGWGGRSANGCRWSARTGWWGRSGDKVGLGAYIYARAPRNDYGVRRYWPQAVTVGRWFAYVQRVKINSPGESNGLLSYWLCTTGACQPQMHMKSIKWRDADVPQAKITEVWANVFCGGANCGVAPWPRSTTSIRRLTVTRGLPNLGEIQAEVAELNNQ